MNAEEARKKTQENSKKEVQKTLALIEAATKKGYTEISVLYVSIGGGVIEWLIQNGYKIKRTGFAPELYIISW